MMTLRSPALADQVLSRLRTITGSIPTVTAEQLAWERAKACEPIAVTRAGILQVIHADGSATVERVFEGCRQTGPGPCVVRMRDRPGAHGAPRPVVSVDAPGAEVVSADAPGGWIAHEVTFPNGTPKEFSILVRREIPGAYSLEPTEAREGWLDYRTIWAAEALSIEVRMPAGPRWVDFAGWSVWLGTRWDEPGQAVPGAVAAACRKAAWSSGADWSRIQIDGATPGFCWRLRWVMDRMGDGA